MLEKAAAATAAAIYILFMLQNYRKNTAWANSKSCLFTVYAEFAHAVFFL